MSNNRRHQAIEAVGTRQIRRFNNALSNDTLKEGSALISESFGINTFDLQTMKKCLSQDVYLKISTSMHSGKGLDPEIAEAVARAVRDWAIERGVTHFCHWFQPQTGLTAEKHDSFLSFDKKGAPIEQFCGAQLIQSEPDASSFPSGGMRTTFEARGYTAWDPSSPIFIMESVNGRTLCIPSVFISYHGHALDEKTPLLRSMEALNEKATELLSVMGQKNVKRAVPTVGPEQEYFLIDKAFYNLRPDLVMTGRTLVGKRPPRGQQLEDHYFGSIPPRVLAFMQEVETELYKLGVPCKTRHNEVAPNQYEMAPIFEEANVAADHNQLVMEVMRRVARFHNFTVLLHEKPFAGINGSGKHCNWSVAVHMEDDSVENLLEPGKTPHENLRFLVVLAAVLKGVHKHNGLLRTAIASPGNDHRLGANEAPPAIMSVFLGDTLSAICDKLESGSNFQQNPEAAVLKLGVSKIPQIARDNTDRNRTSPFAFTGNKFEFRAVGSSMTISFPVTVVNAAVAEAMGELTKALKGKLAAGTALDAAVLEVVRQAIVESKAVRFEGNNYSDQWVVEAEKRGLSHFKKAPEAIELLRSPSSKQLFSGLDILNEQELESRYNISIERYIKKVGIEAESLLDIVDTYVLPAAMREQATIAQGLSATISAVKAVGGAATLQGQGEILSVLSTQIQALIDMRKKLNHQLELVDKNHNESAKAEDLAKKVLPAMEQIREYCDRIEALVSDDLWPLPKYQEMLFLS